MAAKRIDIMELQQLIQLKAKGLINRKVTDALGVSRNTANTYVWAFQKRSLSSETFLKRLPPLSVETRMGLS